MEHNVNFKLDDKKVVDRDQIIDIATQLIVTYMVADTFRQITIHMVKSVIK